MPRLTIIKTINPAVRQTRKITAAIIIQAGLIASIISHKTSRLSLVKKARQLAKVRQAYQLLHHHYVAFKEKKWIPSQKSRAKRKMHERKLKKIAAETPTRINHLTTRKQAQKSTHHNKIPKNSGFFSTAKNKKNRSSSAFEMLTGEHCYPFKNAPSLPTHITSVFVLAHGGTLIAPLNAPGVLIQKQGEGYNLSIRKNNRTHSNMSEALKAFVYEAGVGPCFCEVSSLNRDYLFNQLYVIPKKTKKSTASAKRNVAELEQNDKQMINASFHTIKASELEDVKKYCQVRNHRTLEAKNNSYFQLNYFCPEGSVFVKLISVPKNASNDFLISSPVLTQKNNFRLLKQLFSIYVIKNHYFHYQDPTGMDYFAISSTEIKNMMLLNEFFRDYNVSNFREKLESAFKSKGLTLQSLERERIIEDWFLTYLLISDPHGGNTMIDLKKKRLRVIDADQAKLTVNAQLDETATAMVQDCDPLSHPYYYYCTPLLSVSNLRNMLSRCQQALFKKTNTQELFFLKQNLDALLTSHVTALQHTLENLQEIMDEEKPDKAINQQFSEALFAEKKSYRI